MIRANESKFPDDWQEKSGEIFIRPFGNIFGALASYMYPTDQTMNKRGQRRDVLTKRSPKPKTCLMKTLISLVFLLASVAMAPAQSFIANLSGAQDGGGARQGAGTVNLTIAFGSVALLYCMRRKVPRPVSAG